MDIKVGQDTQGLFAIIYGPNGVQWVRGQRAMELARQFGPSMVPDTDANKAGYINMAGRIIESIGQLAQWYELRQIRLLEEARFEERRIQWLVSCASLVLNDICVNGRIDAKAAFYLSREAGALFDVCKDDPEFDIPATVLYLCYNIRRFLSEFNITSNEYLSQALRDKGVLTTGSSLFGETLKKLSGETTVPSDAFWLEYHSAEKQLEAILKLASEKDSAEIGWKDIAKSTVLLTVFIPLPVFWGDAGIVARSLLITNITRGTAAIYGVQPLFKLLKDMIKNIKDIKLIKMIEEYHDLLLLQLETANTNRLINVQGRLLEGAEQKRLILIGQSPLTALPNGFKAEGR